MPKMPLITPWDIWAKPCQPTRDDFLAGYNDGISENPKAGAGNREGIRLRAYHAGLDQYRKSLRILLMMEDWDDRAPKLIKEGDKK